MKKKSKIRLYTPLNLSSGQEIALNESQSHYLLNVLRQSSGDYVSCFDNKNGEFDCQIITASKKECRLLVEAQTKPYQISPDVWLLFAPVKKDKTDFIIEKATELGCRCISPVITERTIAEKVRIDRFQAQAIEAAEQCRRVDIPEILAPKDLKKILSFWDKSRALYFMDESGSGQSVQEAWGKNPNSKAAVLVGPEGGFSEAELQNLRSQSFAVGVSLGSRILRAETAVVAALSVWQAFCGDWKKEN